ncbi:MAG: EAL domain-containing protein [Nitrospirae bacterium]|nr:EAL domain-containing protein [Nitrospirota bacterium]
MSITNDDILGALKARIEEVGDFPAISRATINLIRKQASRYAPSITEMADTVLNDFGLTKKLLSLVNSVYYANYQLEGKIDSVSQAIFILGYDEVKRAAISLSVLEPLCDKSLPIEAKNAFLSSFMSGSIAREISKIIGDIDLEIVFLCSVFHSLGKLLIAFYMPELSKEFPGFPDNVPEDESPYAKSAPGLSYEEIGIAMANEWNISDDIIGTMSILPYAAFPKPSSKDDRLHCVVCFSNMLSFGIIDIKNNPPLLKQLLQRYSDCFTISVEDVRKVLDVSLKDIKRHAEILKINTDEIPFLGTVNSVVFEAQFECFFETAVVTPVGESTVLTENNYDPIGEANEPGVGYEPRSGDEPGTDDDTLALDSAYSLYSNSIDEVARLLIETDSASEIINLILHIMYEEMGFTRVLFCMRTRGESLMTGKLGCGANINKLIQGFRFEIGKHRNVFDLSLEKNVTIDISDINDPNVKNYIPDWYRKLISPQTFIILPIVINSEPIALFYADREKINDIKLTQVQMQRLKTLSLQAGIALYPTAMNFVSRDADTPRHNKLFWLDSVRSALANNTLIPFYQPIVCNSSGTTTKYECLARIVDGDKIIVPGNFIKYSKEAGFIPLITMEIIKKSIAAFKRTPYEFSINVKEDDINNDYIFEFIKNYIPSTGIRPDRMFFEVQLNECVQECQECKEFIDRTKELRARGFKFAVDNFFDLKSDINFLSRLKADYIKIGSRFVTKIHTSPKHYDAVKAITNYARKTNMKVIATFVQDSNVFADVMKLGIDYSQGYYFGAPSMYIDSDEY